MNTKAMAKRTIVVEIDFVPDESRESIVINARVKSKLAPTASIPTLIYIGADQNGEVTAVEATKQIPGQMLFNGKEQEEPVLLKFARREG
jgi:hypothetical protein